MSLAGCPDEGGENIELAARLYVLNQGEGTLFILNANTLDRIDSVNLEVTNPHYIGFDPEGEFYYVASRSIGGMITKWRASDNTPMGSVQMPFDFQPTSIGITPDGQTGYVVNFGGLDITTRTKIMKLDLSTMTIIPTNMTAGAMTHDCRVSDDGQFAVACNMMTNDVTVIYLDADSVKNISVDPDSLYPTGTQKYGPYGIWIEESEDALAAHGGRRVFIACQHAGQVRVMDLNDLDITDSIEISEHGHGGGSHETLYGPTQVLHDPANDHIFVTTQFENFVWVGHPEGGAHGEEGEDFWILRPQAIQPFGIVKSEDGRRVYFTCVNATGKGWVYAIDNFSHPPRIIDSTEVGKLSYGLAWQPPVKPQP
ncbi:MAG TPA: hypothetical protein VGB22_07110 [candidate division Zixibacteria bacterium]